MKKIIFVSILLSIIAVNTSAQQRTGRMGGSVTGRVLDSLSNEPIEYANIILFSKDDSVMVTGAASNSEGYFEISPLRPGQYYLEANFIGFEKKVIDNIVINRTAPQADLGVIKIISASVNLEDVVVEGERTAVSYQIDKKVINVDQFATSISGNAAEVLENIPSVTVDIEGNVSLRGSSNFRVLIDGRPTILNSQDALQQIPASQIENIEIITNPSAKYDPEGNAGIINIVMKKGRQSGMSGLLNMNAGLNDKYGGDVLGEYKNNSITTILGVDYNRRFSPGSRREERIFSQQNNTTYVNSSGDMEWGRVSLGFRGSVEFNFDDKNILGLSGRAGTREHKRISNSTYEEWTLQNPQHSFYLNNSERERGGGFFALSSNYLHKFAAKGNEISADISFRHSNSDEFTITELVRNNSIINGIKTTEEGPSTDIEGRLDYVLPIGASSRFEAGFEGEMEYSKETTGLQEYDTLSGAYNSLPQFGNIIKYDETEYSLYSIFKSEIGNFGYQGGIRGEYTYRLIEVNSEANQFKIDDWDFFPTAHFSYRFAPGHQIMASYTRRIDRPGGWALEPFYTWIDANSVRIGNPALQPEFIDSYEIGGQTFIGKVSVSSEIYYRVAHNKIEGVRSVYPGASDVTLFTFENIGKDYSLGNEFLINFDIAKIWDVSLMGNIYNYKVKGALSGVPFERSSFNWNSRFSNSFKIGNSWQLQLNAMYRSPTISSQGRREGFVTTDAAVKKEFLDKKLSLTLQVRDIFSTAKHEFSSEGPGFYTYNNFNRESPQVMLNLRYSINNFKQQRERDRRDGFEEGDDF